MGAEGPCAVTLTPAGTCGQDQDTCTYWVHLPPLTVQLPKQLKDLDEIVKEIQRLKDTVDQLRRSCGDCTGNQNERGEEATPRDRERGKDNHPQQSLARVSETRNRTREEWGMDKVEDWVSGNTDPGWEKALEDRGREKIVDQRGKDKIVKKEREKEGSEEGDKGNKGVDNSRQTGQAVDRSTFREISAPAGSREDEVRGKIAGKEKDRRKEVETEKEEESVQGKEKLKNMRRDDDKDREEMGTAGNGGHLWSDPNEMQKEGKPSGKVWERDEARPREDRTVTNTPPHRQEKETGRERNYDKPKLDDVTGRNKDEHTTTSGGEGAGEKLKEEKKERDNTGLRGQKVSKTPRSELVTQRTPQAKTPRSGLVPQHKPETKTPRSGLVPHRKPETKTPKSGLVPQRKPETKTPKSGLVPQRKPETKTPTSGLLPHRKPQTWTPTSGPVPHRKPETKTPRSGLVPPRKPETWTPRSEIQNHVTPETKTPRYGLITQHKPETRTPGSGPATQGPGLLHKPGELPPYKTKANRSTSETKPGLRIQTQREEGTIPGTETDLKTKEWLFMTTSAASSMRRTGQPGTVATSTLKPQVSSYNSIGSAFEVLTPFYSSHSLPTILNYKTTTTRPFTTTVNTLLKLKPDQRAKVYQKPKQQSKPKQGHPKKVSSDNKKDKIPFPKEEMERKRTRPAPTDLDSNTLSNSGKKSAVNTKPVLGLQPASHPKPKPPSKNPKIHLNHSTTNLTSNQTPKSDHKKEKPDIDHSTNKKPQNNQGTKPNQSPKLSRGPQHKKDLKSSTPKRKPGSVLESDIGKDISPDPGANPDLILLSTKKSIYNSGSIVPVTEPNRQILVDAEYYQGRSLIGPNHNLEHVTAPPYPKPDPKAKRGSDKVPKEKPPHRPRTDGSDGHNPKIPARLKPRPVVKLNPHDTGMSSDKVKRIGPTAIPVCIDVESSQGNMEVSTGKMRICTPSPETSTSHYAQGVTVSDFKSKATTQSTTSPRLNYIPEDNVPLIASTEPNATANSDTTEQPDVSANSSIENVIPTPSPGQTNPRPGTIPTPSPGDTNPGSKTTPRPGDTNPGSKNTPSPGDTNPESKITPSPGDTNPGSKTTPRPGGTNPGSKTTPRPGGTNPGSKTTPRPGDTNPGSKTTPRPGGTNPGSKTTPRPGGTNPGSKTTPRPGGTNPGSKTTPRTGGTNPGSRPGGANPGSKTTPNPGHSISWPWTSPTIITNLGHIIPGRITTISPGYNNPGDSYKGDSNPGQSKPETINPGHSNQGHSNAADNTPGHINPGHTKPGHTNTGHSNPGRSNPGHSNPGEDNPGQSNPGDDNPGQSNPGHSNPGDDNPGQSNPGHTNPGDDNPGQSNPGHTNLGESNPGHTNPGRRDPGHTNTGGIKPGHTNTGGINPGHTNTGGIKPGHTNTGGIKPGHTNTGGINPGHTYTADSNRVTIGGGINRGLHNPDIHNPDLRNPDLRNPDLRNPDLRNPDLRNPELRNPDLRNPDLRNPDLRNPELRNPELRSPELRSPDLRNPDTPHPLPRPALPPSPGRTNPGLTLTPIPSTTPSTREMRVKINQVVAFPDASLHVKPQNELMEKTPPKVSLKQGGKKPHSTDGRHPMFPSSKLPRAPRDCSEHLNRGDQTTGLHLVTPDPRLSSFPVFCDMEHQGGGWTVIQRRRDGSVSFNRTWVEYSEGFGEMNGGEFWLGNEKIHLLTRARDMVLRVELEDFEGLREHAEYGKFRVASERQRYRLTVGGYSGSAGDALRFSRNYDHHNKAFTTLDRDNDRYPSGNCGAYYSSGWWFDACMAANLNGRYYVGKYKGVRDGIFWGTWHNISTEYYLTNDRQSFKTVTMMMRPKGHAL
ncbi:unnamed protein product [Arctogadus glacialis]